MGPHISLLVSLLAVPWTLNLLYSVLWSQDLRVGQVKESCIRVEHKRTQ